MSQNKPLGVVFTDKAERDIEKILDYSVREWGRSKAYSYISILESRVYALAENPKVGICRNELAAGVLSFPIDKHVVFYFCTKGELVVLRVLHQSMDPVRHGF